MHPAHNLADHSSWIAVEFVTRLPYHYPLVDMNLAQQVHAGSHHPRHIPDSQGFNAGRPLTETDIGGFLSGSAHGSAATDQSR